MKRYELRYNHFGRRSVLINWPDTIDENILFDQLIFKKSIQDYYIKHKVEVNNAYNSILISYDSAINNIYNEIRLLKSLYAVERSTVPQTFKRITIPVCYAEEFGYDLKRISEHSGLSEQQIISLHSKQDYRVFFIGFLPGFPYLGGMDKRLSCPRLDMPRPKVEMGAVAIGGDQTGIYPVSSPGGWNLIGRTPVELFNAETDLPCLFQAGDKLKFDPISLEEFKSVENKIKSGNYRLKQEVIHD